MAYLDEHRAVDFGPPYELMLGPATVDTIVFMLDVLAREEVRPLQALNFCL